MGATVSTGPTISAGPMLSGYGVPDSNNTAGPGVTYQGDTIPDPRFPISDGEYRIGSIKGHLDSPYILMTDAVPAASAATAVNIAAAANVTSGTAMTLVSAVGAGITPNVPFYPFGSGTLVTSAVTLDFGFSKLNVTNGSGTATLVTATDIGLFSVGQWLVLAAGNTPMVTRVTAVGATTVTISPVANATNATAAVGQGNILDPLSTATATAWTPYTAAGVAGPLNPLDAVTRGIAITGVAGGSGGTLTVRGYDIYGQSMSETITVGAGAVSGYGKKAFKHIISVTPNFTNAFNYSVGTSDVFGLNLRNDKWEYDNFYVAGAFLSVSTGWTPADTTSPATATTGDVRGTIQVGTRGSLGSGAAGGPITGSQRLALFASIPLYNLVSATPANPASMYGVTQA